MKMKKRISVLLIMCLVFGLFLGGCTGTGTCESGTGSGSCEKRKNCRRTGSGAGLLCLLFPQPLRGSIKQTIYQDDRKQE